MSNLDQYKAPQYQFRWVMVHSIHDANTGLVDLCCMELSPKVLTQTRSITLRIDTSRNEKSNQERQDGKTLFNILDRNAWVGINLDSSYNDLSQFFKSLNSPMPTPLQSIDLSRVFDNSMEGLFEEYEIVRSNSIKSVRRECEYLYECLSRFSSNCVLIELFNSSSQHQQHQHQRQHQHQHHEHHQEENQEESREEQRQEQEQQQYLHEDGNRDIQDDSKTLENMRNEDELLDERRHDLNGGQGYERNEELLHDEEKVEVAGDTTQEHGSTEVDNKMTTTSSSTGSGSSVKRPSKPPQPIVKNEQTVHLSDNNLMEQSHEIDIVLEQNKQKQSSDSNVSPFHQSHNNGTASMTSPDRSVNDNQMGRTSSPSPLSNEGDQSKYSHSYQSQPQSQSQSQPQQQQPSKQLNWAQKFTNTNLNSPTRKTVLSVKSSLGSGTRQQPKRSLAPRKKGKAFPKTRDRDEIKTRIHEAIRDKRAIWMSFRGGKQPLVPRGIYPTKWDSHKGHRLAFFAVPYRSKTGHEAKFFLDLVQEVRCKDWSYRENLELYTPDNAPLSGYSQRRDRRDRQYGGRRGDYRGRTSAGSGSGSGRQGSRSQTQNRA